MKLFYIIVFVVFPATIHAIGILSYFAPILFMLIIFRKLNKLLLKCLFNYIATLFLFIPIAIIQTLLLNDAHFALSSQEYLHYKTTTIFIVVYNIYILYTNNIKRKSSANFYSYAFAIIILGLSMLLGYITLSICIENPNSYNLIVIFQLYFYSLSYAFHYMINFWQSLKKTLIIGSSLNLIKWNRYILPSSTIN